MFRFRNFRFLVAAVIAASYVVGSASAAKADFKLYLQEAGVNGGAITEVASGADFTAASFTGTYGDFKVTILGGASDNNALQSDLLGSTTSVTNLSGSTQTLHLYASQTNYSLPAADVNGLLYVRSGLGGSLSTGTLGFTSIFQSWANGNNALLGMTSTAGPQTAIPTGSTFDTGPAFFAFHPGADNVYSVTSVVNFQLSGGGKANFSDEVDISGTPFGGPLPVPAPPGLVLALSGVPFLGFGAWIRRRTAKALAS